MGTDQTTLMSLYSFDGDSSRAGGVPPQQPGMPGHPQPGHPQQPGVPDQPQDPNAPGGMSKNQKIAIGVGAGVAVAAVAAVRVGAGYIMYNKHETAKQDASSIRLHVKIHSARNLIAADRGGTSDPYVVVRAGACGAKTPTVKKNLNPRWSGEESSFEFGLLPELIQTGYLEVSVFDKDLLGDDSIGKSRIPLSAVPRNQPKRDFVRLEGVPTGEVELEMWTTGY